jgi:type IV secretory pathway VirB6-like protein
MIAWLIPIVGERFAKPVFFGLIAVILLGGVFALGRCGGDDTAQRQAEQGNRSGEAIAGAARQAIATIGDRTASDKTVDQAVDQATKDIDDAQDVDVIRGVVIDSVCQSASHRNDPACRVR